MNLFVSRIYGSLSASCSSFRLNLKPFGTILLVYEFESCRQADCIIVIIPPLNVPPPRGGEGRGGGRLTYIASLPSSIITFISSCPVFGGAGSIDCYSRIYGTLSASCNYSFKLNLKPLGTSVRHTCSRFIHCYQVDVLVQSPHLVALMDRMTGTYCKPTNDSVLQTMLGLHETQGHFTHEPRAMTMKL